MQQEKVEKLDLIKDTDVSTMICGIDGYFRAYGGTGSADVFKIKRWIGFGQVGAWVWGMVAATGNATCA